MSRARLVDLSAQSSIVPMNWRLRGADLHLFTEAGISDGFLAPYKVIKFHIDRDVEDYRPELGQLDRERQSDRDRIYKDRNIVLDDRTVLTAKKVTEFLKEGGDRFQKTIMFASMRTRGTDAAGTRQ